MAERPSVAIVLGTLSGFLAGFLYLPISIPLVFSASEAEEAIAVRECVTAADTIDRWMVSGTALTPLRLQQLGVNWASVQAIETDTVIYAIGEPNPAVMAEAACVDGTGARTLLIEGDTWATTCQRTATHRIATGLIPTHQTSSQVMYWTFILAVVVGIVTALAQARLLRPLTEMSQALERVGRGERGVRLQSTGLAELDAVVDRINEAAEHVEERVDAITARITVVQEMARLVAHEVRNPLQSLELLTSLIASEEDAKERTDIQLSIRDEIQALDQVVHRLLREGATTGALRLQRKVLPIAPFLEQVIKLRREEARRRGIHLSMGVISPRTASVDGAMLGRSIENLVTNALQAVSENGGEVRLSLFEEARFACVAVDDNGPGVPSELGATIFEPEVTGRETGTGLGLALVRAVIVAHGGTIEYTTSPLGGARFLARIPFEEDQTVGAQDA